MAGAARLKPAVGCGTARRAGPTPADQARPPRSQPQGHPSPRSAHCAAHKTHRPHDTAARFGKRTAVREDRYGQAPGRVPEAAGIS
jgi:hypothetical protein